MKKISAFFFFPMLINFLVCQNAFSNEAIDKKIEITQAKAIEMAILEAKMLAFVIDELNIEADPTVSDRQSLLKNHPWFRQEGMESMPFMRRLDNRRFWVIYFSPKPEPYPNQEFRITLDGDLWVFIDAYSGESLLVPLRQSGKRREYQP